MGKLDGWYGEVVELWDGKKRKEKDTENIDLYVGLKIYSVLFL